MSLQLSRTFRLSRRKLIIALCATISSIICFVALTIAENGAPNSSNSSNSSLRVTPGLDEKQLRETLGEPDRRSSEQGSLQFWYYGKSTVIVEEGIVQGVSDRGDLANRRAQYRPKQENLKIRDPEVGDDWINPWTGPETTKATDIHQLLR